MTVHGRELTSYGHCYQHLIYQALDRARVKSTEIDAYLNVLSELGKTILSSPSERLDDEKLDDFFRQYSISFLPIDRSKVIKDLVNSYILKETEQGLEFRYRYLFYFFAAKNLADSLHQGNDSKNKVQELIDTIYLEKSSNIILFLTHHSKDPWIIDSILYSIMEIFPEEKEANLDAGSLSFLDEFIKEIPDLIGES